MEERATEAYESMKKATSRSELSEQKSTPSYNVKPVKEQYRLAALNTGGRSPIQTKSIEHTYGTMNLPSDSIGAVVANQWMHEAAELSRQRKERLQKAKSGMTRGLQVK